MSRDLVIALQLKAGNGGWGPYCQGGLGATRAGDLGPDS